MEQGEFATLVDEWEQRARRLVDLVEQARYEQPTARAISQLLDAREQVLWCLRKLPALRAAAAPELPAAALAAPAGFADRIAATSARLKTDPDATEALQLAADALAWFAALVAPLQAAGRWPKTRGRMGR